MHRRAFLSLSGAALANALAAPRGLAGRAEGTSDAPSDASAPDALARLDATAQAELVRRGEITARELLESAILRIEALDPTLNVIATPAYEQALAAADRVLPEGPFRGVPTLIKDVTDYAGVRRTSGSRSLAGHVSTRTGDYVRAAQAAGLIVLAKSTTPEFGLLPTTEALLTGATRNPWNLAHSTSGSSGGSAAAVAAGLVPLAHATDGGGSIRNPANACGVFGLKPSNGRLIGATDKGASGALSVNGCISRSVRDTAALLAATERRDAAAFWPPVGAVTSPTTRRLRIALSTVNLYGREAEPEVKRAIRATARLCESLGHRVEEAAPAIDGERFIEQFLVIYGAGAWQAVEEYRKRTTRMPDESLMEPFTLRMAEAHQRLPPDAGAHALTYFAQVERAVAIFFERHDATLTPVMRTVAPKLGYLAPDGPYATVLERAIDYASYTPLHNVASVPAMSVPLGWTRAGLPIGSHFAARQGDERTLLELAYELEAARPWVARRPPHGVRTRR